MTEQQQQQQPADQQQQDADSLIPVLAMLLSAYLGHRAVTNRGELTREQLLAPLGIEATAAYALEQLALRVLAWQRRSHGRAGDELIPFTAQGVQAGVRAGVEVIGDSIVDFDKDPAALHDRPRVLAAMARGVARTTGNAAQEAIAQAAGWGHKVWMTQQDGRVRSTHRPMQGQRVPLGQKFTAGDGRSIDYPGDPTTNADLWVNCRCWMITERQ